MSELKIITELTFDLNLAKRLRSAALLCDGMGENRIQLSQE